MGRLRLPLAAIGFTSTIAQIVLLREMVATFYGNELLFGLVLMAWLAWVAAGSWGLGSLFQGKESRASWGQPKQASQSAESGPAKLASPSSASGSQVPRGSGTGTFAVGLVLVAFVCWHCGSIARSMGFCLRAGWVSW